MKIQRILQARANHRKCFECRNGEHDNYDDYVSLCIIKDPDTQKLYRRGYLCGQHQAMYDDDGYIIIKK
jgi:hypothetical protein